MSDHRGKKGRPFDEEDDEAVERRRRGLVADETRRRAGHPDETNDQKERSEGKPTSPRGHKHGQGQGQAGQETKERKGGKVQDDKETKDKKATAGKTGTVSSDTTHTPVLQYDVELQTMRTLIEKLQADNKYLNTELQAEKQKSTSQLADKKRRFEGGETGGEAASAAEAKHTAEMENLRRQLNEQQEAAKKAQEEKEAAEKRAAAAETERKTREEQLSNQLRDAQQARDREVTAARQELEGVRTQNNDIDRLAQERKKDLDTAERARQSAQEGWGRERDHLQEQLGILREQLRAADEQQKKAREKETKDHNEQLERDLKQLQDAQRDAVALREQLNAKNVDWETRGADIKRLAGELATMGEDRNRLRDLQTGTLNERNRLEADLKTQEAATQAARLQLTQEQARTNALAADVDRLRTQVQNRDGELDALRKRIAELEAQLRHERTEVQRVANLLYHDRGKLGNEIRELQTKLMTALGQPTGGYKPG